MTDSLSPVTLSQEAEKLLMLMECNPNPKAANAMCALAAPRLVRGLLAEVAALTERLQNQELGREDCETELVNEKARVASAEAQLSAEKEDRQEADTQRNEAVIVCSKLGAQLSALQQEHTTLRAALKEIRAVAMDPAPSLPILRGEVLIRVDAALAALSQEPTK